MMKILACTCVQTYQDTKYGVGRRMHNSCGGKGSRNWCCTSCGNTKQTAAPVKAAIAAAEPQAGAKKNK